MANPKGNPQNLKPVRSTDEAKKKGAAGGKASGAARRKKRDARSAINMILNLPAHESLEKNLQALGMNEEDWTNMGALWARIFTDAIGGDHAARKMIFDYGGFNPEFMLREKESKAKIRAMKEESERRALFDDDDDDDGESSDVVVVLPDNGRGDGPKCADANETAEEPLPNCGEENEDG